VNYEFRQSSCQFTLVALMMLVMDMHAMGAYFAVTLFAPHMIMIMAARRALHYSLALLQIVVFHKRHSPLYPLIMALPHLGHLMLEHGDPGWWGALAPQPGQTQFPPRPGPGPGSSHSAATCSPTTTSSSACSGTTPVGRPTSIFRWHQNTSCILFVVARYPLPVSQ